MCRLSSQSSAPAPRRGSSLAYSLKAKGSENSAVLGPLDEGAS